MWARRHDEHRFGAPPAQVQVIFRCPDLVRKSLDGDEIPSQTANLAGDQLIELLLAVGGKFSRIKLEQDRDVPSRLVIIKICNPIVQFAAQLVFHLVRFLGSRIGPANRVARPRVGRGSLLIRGADLGLCLVQLFLRILLFFVHLADLAVNRVDAVRDISFRCATSEQHYASHDRYAHSLHAFLPSALFDPPSLSPSDPSRSG